MKRYKCIKSYSCNEESEKGTYLGQFIVEEGTIWEAQEQVDFFIELKSQDSDDRYLSASPGSIREFFQEMEERE